MKWVNSHAYCRHVQYTPVLTCATRSSAIAGRQCDANACQRLLKWTWKWQPSWHNLQMSFKVINSGTNRNLVYDFLLMVYSNFCHITHRFLKKIDVKQFNDLEILPRSSTVASRESCHVAMYVKCSQDSEERSENRHVQRPHSHLTPPPQEAPANICIDLMLPETTFPELHFCRWQYMGSAANVRTVLSENRRGQPIRCQARNRF